MNAPITFTGGSGTPVQNSDLAGKLAREMRQTMESVINDQMRKQMRPGNMLSSR